MLVSDPFLIISKSKQRESGRVTHALTLLEPGKQVVDLLLLGRKQIQSPGLAARDQDLHELGDLGAKLVVTAEQGAGGAESRVVRLVADRDGGLDVASELLDAGNSELIGGKND
jgi:hypothetical protein